MTFDIQAAIRQDDALPATAFRINGDGVLAEGVYLEMNHPLTGGVPALFVGSTYMKRDSYNGCFYRFENGRCVARRIEIEEFPLEGKKLPVRVLRRPSSESTIKIVLHIDPKVDLGKNVKLNSGIAFKSGVEHTGELIHQSFDGEMLIEMIEDATATVFYTDGKVSRVSRKGNALTAVSLTLEEQAELRLSQALRGVEAANGDPKGTDFWFHQMVTLLAVGGKRSQVVFDRLYDCLSEAATSGKMGYAVKDRAIDVLKKLSGSHALAFGLAFESRHSASMAASATDFPEAPKAPAKKGPPPERKQKLAIKAERDRSRAKGGSGGGHSKIVTAVNPKTIRKNERRQGRAAARK